MSIFTLDAYSLSFRSKTARDVKNMVRPIFKKVSQLVADFVLTPYRGFATGPHWGLLSPRIPIPSSPHFSKSAPGKLTVSTSLWINRDWISTYITIFCRQYCSYVADGDKNTCENHVLKL